MRIAMAAAVACLSVVSLAAGQDAQAAMKHYELDISKQSLDSALRDLAQQTGLQIALFSDTIDGNAVVGPVSGTQSAEEALKTLLAPSQLTYKVVTEGTIAVLNPKDPPVTAPARAEKNKSFWDRFRISQADSPAKPDPSENRKSSASEIPEGVSQDRDAGLQEVLVTAQKREQRLQDTPMSLSVLGGREVEQRGLAGMGDYLSSVPGVSVLDQAAGKTSIVMRGLAANAQDDLSHGPLVGVYLGEVPLAGLATFGSSTDIKLVDVERIEVLRGPQGTLYGSSSLGGTVRNIPVAPNLQAFEGSVRIGASNTEGLGGGNGEIRAVLNFPIIADKLGVRLVGYRMENSGFYQNVAGDDPDTLGAAATWGAVAESRKDVGSDEYTGGRIAILWQPTERLGVKLNYLRQKIHQDGWPQADLELGLKAFQQRRLKMVLPSGPNAFTAPRFDEKYDDDIEISNAVLEFDLGWSSLLSSSSWINESNSQFRELASFFEFIPWSQPIGNDSKAFVQEVRLVSQLKGPLQFVAGVYYQDVDVHRRAAGIWGGDPSVNAYGGPTDLSLTNGHNYNDLEQRAFFGELSFELTEKLKLTAGGRVFSYDRSIVAHNEPALFFPDGTLSSVDTSESDSNFKGGVEFAPVRDTLLYATFSQGFRLGRPVPENTQPVCDQDGDGFFDGSGGVSTAAYRIDSDFVDSYELGAKRAFLDNRLQVNASAFRWKWKGVPISKVFDFCSATLNAGQAKSRGAELDTTFHVSDDVWVTLGGSYVNAKLTEDAVFLGEAGDRLPGSPKYNVHAGLQYRFMMGGRESFVRGDYFVVGGFYNNLQETGPKIGDYGMLNLRLGTTFGSISAEVFAHNIMNEDALTWVDSEGFVNQRGNLLRPRTIGASLSYRF